MDRIDQIILARLAANARISWADLAVTVGLTGPAVADRVKKLEQAGVITGYTTLISPEAVGADLTAFIAVTIDSPQHTALFLAGVQGMGAVLECHHVAGDDSYLLKVRTSGTKGLERLVTDSLKRLPGVTHTRSTIVLSTAKESPLPPMPSGSLP
jgi:Lrp/AsnC family leucine-responsive transcriptional regulator